MAIFWERIPTFTVLVLLAALTWSGLTDGQCTTVTLYFAKFTPPSNELSGLLSQCEEDTDASAYTIGYHDMSKLSCSLGTPVADDFKLDPRIEAALYIKTCTAPANCDTFTFTSQSGDITAPAPVFSSTSLSHGECVWLCIHTVNCMTVQHEATGKNADTCNLYNCHNNCTIESGNKNIFTRNCYTSADCGFAPRFPNSYSDGDFYIDGSTEVGSTVKPWCGVGWKTVTNASRTCQPDGTWSPANWACVEEDCGAPAAIPNGNWSYNITLYGHVANITCDKGHKLLRGSTDLGPYSVTSYTCADTLLEMARWEHVNTIEDIVPTCPLVDCGPLTLIINGTVTIDKTTYLGQADYTCNYGSKVISGDTTRMCTDFETWNGTQPECGLIDCGTPPPPANGNVNAPSTLLDQNATYSCTIGYDLIGFSVRTCNSNSLSDFWSDTMPVCQLVDCNTPVIPLNGSVSSGPTTYNERKNFSCDPGFDISGIQVLTCMDSGAWDNSSPTCVIKDCGTPPPTANGSAGYSQTTFTSVATYSCSTGYDLTGNSQLTCNSSGLWGQQEPDCIIVDCGQPITSLNGSMTVGATTYEETATFGCDNGFDLTGPHLLECDASGTWNDTEPICQIKDCGLPPSTPDGFPTYSLTTYQSSAVYACNPGYNLTGQQNLTCDVSGLWDNPAPTCPRVNCGTPVAPTNGLVNYTVTTYESLAFFSCNIGYDLSGVSMFACATTAVWNDTDPTCVIKDCGSPPSTPDGTVDYTTTVYLSSADYTCNTGYNLTGEPTVTCNSSGQWDKPTPTCPIMNCGPPFAPVNGTVVAPVTTYLALATFTCNTGFDLVGTPVLTCNAVAQWNDTWPHCELKACGAPSNTANGFVNFNLTTYESVATYNCETGYNLIGDSNLTCNASGDWDKLEPQCQIRDCGHPLAPTNGTVTVTATTYQGQATFYCDAGFDIIGSSILNCIASGVWNDTDPTCDIKDCGPPQNATDGNVDYTTTAYESSATYFCNPGYNLTGDAILFCNASGLWDKPEPTCPRVNCGYPIIPVNGSVDLNATTYESHAVFDCDSGFDLRGSAFRVCNSSAAWTDDDPECDIKECGSPPNTTDGSRTFTSTTYLSQATYICDVGYNLTGHSILNCNASGLWHVPAPQCHIVDCGQPLTPLNGSVSADVTTYTEQAVFACEDGFYVAGPVVLECQADGDWNDTEPTCERKDCGLPPSIFDGQANYSLTTYQSRAVYYCYVGYNLTGNADLQCNASGLWDVQAPTCQIVDCGDPAQPVNGTVIASPTTFGEYAIFSCDVGFYLIGHAVLECTASSVWNDTEPTCELHDCGPPTNTLNGDVNYTQTIYGSLAAYECNTGYTLTGDSTLVCNAAGMWNTSVPTCPIKDCGIPSTPLNGSLNVNDTTYQDIAVYACDIGFYMIGYPVLQCNASGHWNDSVPSCQIKDCGHPANTTYGSVNYSSTTYGSEAHYTCDTGYNLTGSPILECNANAIWISGVPSCQIVDCGPPSAPANGSVSVISNVTTYQGLAIFTCDAGFDVDVPSALECTASGAWNDTEPKCQLKNCGTPSNTTNGFVSYELQTFGSEATYTCRTGYDIIGATTLTCNATGYWDNPAPTCQIKDCGLPLNPANGSITAVVTTFEGTVTFACDTGFNIIGPYILVCEASGFWNDSNPTCELKNCGPPSNTSDGSVIFTDTTYQSSATYSCNSGYNLTGMIVVTCSEFSSWDFPAPVCSRVNCGSPSAPLNGSVYAPISTYESLATFSCDPGFDINGLSVLVCSASAVWNDTEPTCDIKDCGPLLSVTDGYVNYTDTTYTSSALYACNAGYNLTGSPDLTCNEFGVWDKPPPACKIVDCGLPSQPLNGNVVAINTTYEGQAHFSCDAGFNVNGPSILECNAFALWNDTEPTCELKDCGPPVKPLNGSVSTTATTYGGKANFTCEYGFFVNGPVILECNASAEWNESEPTCELMDCYIPPNTTDGFVNYTLTTFGSKAVYSCKTGYNISSFTELTCGGSGTWDTIQPACIIVDCGILADPSNGTATYTNTTYLSVATYYCGIGYSLNGTLSRFCQDDGQWNSSDPTCDFTDCGPLLDPLNGTVFVGSSLYLGKADYACDQGHVLIGSNGTRCLASGLWSNMPATCSYVDCGSLIAVPNGNVDFTDTFYEAMANYSCNAGYDLNGTVWRTCNSSGFWEPDEPLCVIRSCGDLGSQTYGFVLTENGTTVGELATYDCFPGYILLGAPSRECLTNASWGGVEPTCEPKDCGGLAAPTYGNVSTPLGTTFPEAAFYSCDTGYVLSGTSPRFCQTSGNWSSTDPTCGRADCGVLDPPANGRVTTAGGTKYGKTAIYKCDPGFIVKGLPARVCLASGAWSAGNITCIDEATAPKKIYIAPCRCQGNATFLSNLTEEQIVEYLIDATWIDPTNTSLARSKLECAHDPRTSAFATGILGAGLLFAVLVILLLLDSVRVWRWFTGKQAAVYRSSGRGAAGAAGGAAPRPQGGASQGMGMRRRFSRI